MKQTLNLKVSQQLSLTPQLKQSLLLLQLSSQDLELEVQSVLEENPLLERVENESSLDTETTPQADLDDRQNSVLESEQSPATASEEPADVDGDMDFSEGFEAQPGGETDWQESFETRRTPQKNSSDERGSDNLEFSHYLSKAETLVEHLDWQIQMTALTERDKLIAETLIQSLDKDGYLSIELDEICGLFPPALAIEPDEVHAVLSLIRTLDPIGVGARNLQQRLLILLGQLPDETRGLASAKIIVSEHLSLLAARNYSRLRRLLDISEEMLVVSLNVITGLNPRIANKFSEDNQDQIIPDVIVKRVSGRWQAQLNPENQTKLRTNQEYAKLLKTGIDEQGSEYIQKHLNQARTFIKGLMSRYDTLLLVSQAIVDRQQAFFDQGEKSMQAMILQDIAEQLDLHESTVSRATSGKFLSSPRGVFELKYFFSSSLAGTDGEGSSSTAIRSLIRNMIEDESKLKPLSDSKIVKELESQGHIVARRTVAKYRESMQIAPSNQRKTLTH